MDEKLVIAVLVVAVLLFGGKKLQEISRSAGRSLGEFKKGKMEAEKELKALGKKKS